MLFNPFPSKTELNGRSKFENFRAVSFRRCTLHNKHKKRAKNVHTLAVLHSVFFFLISCCSHSNQFCRSCPHDIRVEQACRRLYEQLKAKVTHSALLSAAL